MSRKAKKAMAVALTAGMLASTAATPVMAATAGWKQNAKGWWYENADGTYPANKWQSIGGKWYYFDANGYMVSGWKQIPAGGKWYYFGGTNDGAMKDGWFKDTTGQYSYAKPGDGAVYQDGWKQEPNGDWYYLDPNGYMQEGGWAKTGNHWYFLRNDGVMQTGIIDVDGEVFYLNEDGDMFVGEKTIGDVTYTFDAYGKAVGDKIPTATKAFKKDGTPVAVKEEERELSVTSVTSITKNVDGDFVVTALLSEEVTADTLKDTTLTLKNGSITVTAKFDSVSGATAVYKIADTSKLTPQDSSADGSYVVSSSTIDIATGLTAAYEETLVGNSVQGFVYYQDDAGEYHFLEKATVKVGNKTVTTNDKGFYTIAATSGSVTVEASANDFFGKTAKTYVSRNYPSTQNIQLTKYDREKLFINGTILDSTDNDEVADVKVELQKKGTDGKYTTIATAYTLEDKGTFVFANSKADYGTTKDKAAEAAKGSSQDDTDGIVTFKDDDANRLSKDETYQLKVTKAYNRDAATNGSDYTLYDAYKESIIPVTLSTTDAQTNLKNIMLTPVKALNSANISMSWNEDIAKKGTKLNVTLRDTDGKTKLAEVKDIRNALTNNIDKNSMKNQVTLVQNATVTKSLFTQAPTLPAGTYYFVVDDGKNALCVVPVDVTEGGDVVVSGTFQEANSGTITTSVLTVVYKDKVKEAYSPSGTPLTRAGIISYNSASEKYEATDGTLKVDYDVYQKVGNVKVLVASKTDTTYDYDASKTAVKAETALDKLVAGETYVCVPTENYIADSTPDNEVKVEKNGSASNPTNDVQSAANITSVNLGKDFVKADGSALADDTKIKVTSIKIVDATTNATVKEVTDIEDTFTTAGGLEFDIPADKLSKLAGIPAGEYKAIISLEGFAAVTTDKFTLVDFEEATLTTDKQFKQNALTTITGYIRYADDNTAVGAAESEGNIEALALLYDASGNVVAYDLIGETTVSADGNYKIDETSVGADPKVKLSAGTYKLVIRGKDFETVVKEVELKANETVTYNVDVTRHEGGEAVLTIRDTNNYGWGAGSPNLDGKLDTADDYYKPVLRDANYVKPGDDDLDKNNIIETLSTSCDAKFLGEYKTVDRVAGNKDVEYTTAAVLSVGKYNIWVPATDKAYEEKTTVSIANVDATSYKDIVTTAKTSGKTIPLTVKFDATVTTDKTPTVINTKDVVVIEDVYGKVLDRQFVDVNSTVGDQVKFDVVADATYVVKVYSEGNFVASQKVTVQGISKSVTVALDGATRN